MRDAGCGVLAVWVQPVRTTSDRFELVRERRGVTGDQCSGVSRRSESETDCGETSSSDFGAASWLNQVEIWFGILSRKALRGLSSTSTAELRQAIETFIKAYAEHAKPFKWRKREVKGSQLRNTIVNLCN